MSSAIKTLNKMKKTNKLVQLYFRQEGPRSYKRGVGALLAALAEEDRATQRKLCVKLGLSRKDLKAVVKKAVRKGYVTIQDTDADKTYIVELTETGKELAKKRDAAQKKAADKLAKCLTDEELANLDAICEKLIVATKDAGVCGKKKGRKHHAKRRKCCRR